ncbi:sigma factor [Butyrivibrio sp. AE3004]|uniref:sigma factor n=1 Tax=Butyrivibrio sp. AE3004 TaxID=1506994 RepID=UPI000493DA30|nr:sigma factor [Butyrivibrio sp. AE3004]
MASDALSSQVLAARTDNKALSKLVQGNDKFIRKCAYYTVHRFITEHDDEYSVALSAFLEAVMSYDPDSGSFSSFAQVVIGRRLTDFLRSEYRRQPEVVVDPSVMGGDYIEEELSDIATEVRAKNATTLSAEDTKTSSRITVRDEIDALSVELSKYGIDFFTLAKNSPTSRKTKEACRTLLDTILRDDDLLNRYKKNHTLPVMDLASASGISKKIIDKYRRYLIASIEILTGDYPLLSEYLKK